MIEKIKKALKFIIIILALMIIIINTTLIIKSEINSNEIPDVLGFTPFIVVSGSMEPNISVNDMIIIKKVKTDDIKVGDIISYRAYQAEGDNIIITHRVINITENRMGEKMFETKGDNNDVSDLNLVNASQIQRKYLFKVPLIGRLVYYVRNPRGMTLVIVFIICIYVLYDIAIREHMRKKYKSRISQ